MLSANAELAREEIINGRYGDFSYILDEELTEEEANVIVDELEEHGFDAFYVFEEYEMDGKLVEYIVIYKL